MQFYIDIVGTCNLRCPSCPVGSLGDVSRPKGFMDLDRFVAILDKIAADYPDEAVTLGLFNWGEPLLHPQAADFVREVRRRGWPCALSSNMSVASDLAPVVAARPTGWRISMSGGRDDTYGVTHKKGRLETVLANMRRLRVLMNEMRHDMDVEVFYHLYRSNLGDELTFVRDLARDLGFRFTAIVAYMMPVENYLRLVVGSLAGPAKELLGEYLIHPNEVLDLTARRRLDRRCDLIEHTMAIGFDGSVDLCCATYEPGQRIADDFLSVTRVELDARRRSSRFCVQCMSLGVHKIDDAMSAADPVFADLLRRRLESIAPNSIACELLGLKRIPA